MLLIMTEPSMRHLDITVTFILISQVHKKV